MIGKHIMAVGKSLHAGYAGVVVADYQTMLLVKSDDDSYVHAGRNSIGEGKYFQIDSRMYKEIKETNGKNNNTKD